MGAKKRKTRFGAASVIFILTAFVFLFVVFQHPIKGFLGLASDDDQPSDIVHLLNVVDMEKAEYGVIFGPVITGDTALLVTDTAWLQAHSEALWFKDEDSIGSIIGGMVLGMMGMPLQRHIASVVQGDVVVGSFFCINVNCIHGLTSGMDKLAGAIPGVPVALQSEFHDEYEAYLAAHARALADPNIWFADAGGAIVQPPDDGIRHAVIAWPAELVDAPPNVIYGYEDPEARARIDAWIAALIGETSAEVTSISMTEGMPLWLSNEQGGVFDEGGSVALPDISLRSAAIRLSLHVSDRPELERLYRANPPPLADLTKIAPEIYRAFTKFGFDTGCLPGCGSVHQSGLDTEASLGFIADPFWRLKFWQVVMPGG